MVKNLLNLFFPDVCEACFQQLRDHESVICTSCRHQLPVTNFHFNGADDVKKVLYGRVRLEAATSLFHFAKKGLVQQLMHNLKYRGHQQISQCLGEWLGSELKASQIFQEAEVVVPVPLHKKRLRKRGYNQVDLFGRAIALALDIPYEDKVLLKVKSTQTQVFKQRLKRWNQDDGLFNIRDQHTLKDKHILIVDDIITTGATIEQCATCLKQIEGVKFSLATMAITD